MGIFYELAPLCLTFHTAPMSLILLLPNNDEEIKVPIGKVTCLSNLWSRGGISTTSLSDIKAYVLVSV